MAAPFNAAAYLAGTRPLTVGDVRATMAAFGPIDASGVNASGANDASKAAHRAEIAAKVANINGRLGAFPVEEPRDVRRKRGILGGLTEVSTGLLDFVGECIDLLVRAAPPSEDVLKKAKLKLQLLFLYFKAASTKIQTKQFDIGASNNVKNAEENTVKDYGREVTRLKGEDIMILDLQDTQQTIHDLEVLIQGFQGVIDAAAAAAAAAAPPQPPQPPVQPPQPPQRRGFFGQLLAPAAPPAAPAAPAAQPVAGEERFPGVITFKKSKYQFGFKTYPLGDNDYTAEDVVLNNDSTIYTIKGTAFPPSRVVSKVVITLQGKQITIPGPFNKTANGSLLSFTENNNVDLRKVQKGQTVQTTIYTKPKPVPGGRRRTKAKAKASRKTNAKRKTKRRSTRRNRRS